MCTAPRKEQFVIFSEEHDYRVIKSFSDCNREIRIKIDSLNIDITKRCWVKISQVSNRQLISSGSMDKRRDKRNPECSLPPSDNVYITQSKKLHHCPGWNYLKHLSSRICIVLKMAVVKLSILLLYLFFLFLKGTLKYRACVWMNILRCIPESLERAVPCFQASFLLSVRSQHQPVKGLIPLPAFQPS